MHIINLSNAYDCAINSVQATCDSLSGSNEVLVLTNDVKEKQWNRDLFPYLLITLLRWKKIQAQA